MLGWEVSDGDGRNDGCLESTRSLGEAFLSSLSADFC